jgi:hypothetical protein
VTDVRLDFGATLRRGDELPRQRLDLEDAEDRQSRLRDRRDRLRTEIGEVAAFRAEPPVPRPGDPPRWAPVESILSLAGFIDSRLAVLHRRLRAAEDELDRADHDVDVLRHRLDQVSTALNTGRAEPSVSAVLTLALDRARADADTDGDGDTADPTDSEAETGTVAVELEYHVPGATWAPVYQLRLDGRTGAGTLVLRACVAQRTGEVWTGVRLGLSTADLLRRADLPELRSLRIGRSQEEPQNLNWREPPAGLEELFAGYDAAVPPAPDLAPGGIRLTERSGPGATLDEPVRPGAPPAAPIRASSSAPSRGKARARHSVQLRAPAAPGGPRPDTSPAEAFLSADLLDYTRLAMTGPDAADGRGTLRPGSTGKPALVTEYRRRADAVARLARPAHAVDVRASAGSFDYRFDTAAPVDVEADGLWHTVPVSEVAVRTEFEYVCVPSVDQSVFGTVLVTNTSSHALLAGPVDVMVDGDFVLTAALPTLAPGQRQAVGVGVAESVRVARRAHMRESTAGMRGGTTVLDHTVEVEVANRLPYPVVVEVRERIPVSTDKDVRIEEHSAKPPWAEPGQPLGGQEESYVRGARVWRVELEPGRTTTLTGGFEIRFPVGKAAVGGNRRN